MAKKQQKKQDDKQKVMGVRVDVNQDGKPDTVRIYFKGAGRRSKPARVWLGKKKPAWRGKKPKKKKEEN